ncbi:mechanosensitive ion channel protein MscL [Erysipelothrix urinaevulpis]|nr:mechanosensitive ion channel protein MscL [Erysipelothrix urinaevulpis]
MIETFDDVIGLVSLILIVIAGIIGFIKLNNRLNREEDSDEFYRELL